MKFTFKDHIDTPDFQPDENWNPLQGAKNLWLLQLQAFPFVVLNMGVVILFFWLLKLPFTLITRQLFISFLIFIPLHEFVHALTFPVSLRSSKIYLGFSLQSLVPYADYDGAMTKSRALVNLVAPFFVISGGALIVLVFTDHQPLLEHVALFNAMASCVDMLSAWQIARKVPAGACLRAKNDTTYWCYNSSTDK